VVLCADDFALSAAVSEAVLTLLASHRISVTSCMTQSPRWAEDGARLREAGLSARAGLHFNLTEAFSDAPAEPLARWIIRALAGRIDLAQVATRLETQLDHYEAVMGAPPAFVDGHQHVHQFPGVRRVLRAVLERRYRRAPWLRATAPMRGPVPFAKRMVLLALGADRFSAQLGREGWRHNPGFGGFYDFSPGADYGCLMRRWLADCQSGDVLMVHPATAATPADAIGGARHNEYRWLSGPDWPALLQAMDIRLWSAPDGAPLPLPAPLPAVSP
jgi:predicted glycoside hydrolase/deacetylase ChbG (UPF0249 family)